MFHNFSCVVESKAGTYSQLDLEIIKKNYISSYQKKINKNLMPYVNEYDFHGIIFLPAY